MPAVQASGSRYGTRSRTRSQLAAPEELKSATSPAPIIQTRAKDRAKDQAKDRAKNRAKDRPVVKKPTTKTHAKETATHVTSNTDPILEHLKVSYKTSNSIDKELLDQVALEGLAGITLDRLFRMLDSIFPTLNSVKETHSQNYIWSVVVNKYLKNPSGSNLQIFYVDPNKPLPGEPTSKLRPIKLPHQTVDRMLGADAWIYPAKNGPIMGSCRFYKSRQDISQEVLDFYSKVGPSNSLKKIHDKYNILNLYIVAHQELRRKAILPNWADPNLDIKLGEYCTLELIGKSRTMGTVFPNDKTLGRYRIMLMKKGLITQYQPTSSSPIEHHLKRFSHLLAGGLVEAGFKLKTKDATDYNSDDDDGQQPLVKVCCDPDRLKVDRDTLTMVYDSVNRRPEGITHIGIRRRLRMPKFHVRNHIKNLISIRMVGARSYKRAMDDDNSSVLYKAAYKTKRWSTDKLKTHNAEKEKGAKAKWDERDIKAKEVLGFRRSSFTQAEDSFLILCRITSILIHPTCRLSWCVHKRLIRNLLHSELIESNDKTSDACLRRIKYLRRLPNNSMSINELTAELRDDPDVLRLTQSALESDDRLNKTFVQTLRVVQAKMPHLLGIASDYSSSFSGLRRRTAGRAFGFAMSNRPQIMDSNGGGFIGGLVDKDQIDQTNSRASNSAITNPSINMAGSASCKTIEISEYSSLKNYELVECESVPKFNQSSTFEGPKNSVDMKYNSASLVTIAFTLINRLDPIKDREREQLEYRKLDKFLSKYPDKMVTSMLSKLNKRSILVRKNPQQSTNMEQIGLKGARTRVALKLNQNVLYLLSRNNSSSLMQLVQPISQLDRIDLSESNEMASIAVLTSLCSLSSFQLKLRLKIPGNVVSIDQGNENFKTMYESASEETREVLSRFMIRCGQPSPLTLDNPESATKSPISKADAPEPTSSHRGVATRSNSSSRTASEPKISLDKRSLSPLNQAPNDFAVAASAGGGCRSDESRRALFLLRHELKSHALDKCGNLADCLVVQPCKIHFIAENLVDGFSMQFAMEEFLNTQQNPTKQETNWLVKGFKERQSTQLTTSMEDEEEADVGGENPGLVPMEVDDHDKQRERDKASGEMETSGEVANQSTAPRASSKSSGRLSRFESVEYSARLWKRLDGTVHMRTLLKLIESILSWLIVSPGIELNLLQREFGHFMPDENLTELLDLMESLGLISRTETVINRPKARLFGASSVNDPSSGRTLVTYEPSSSAYIKYAHLLAIYSK